MVSLFLSFMGMINHITHRIFSLNEGAGDTCNVGERGGGGLNGWNLVVLFSLFFIPRAVFYL